MKIAYCDCIGGAAGDMLLGALVASGLKLEALQKEIAKLSLPEVRVTVHPVKRQALAAAQIEISAPEAQAYRHLKEIEQIISTSGLADAVKLKSLAIFHRLAEAEARVHGSSVEEIHFHELGAVDTIVDVVGSVAGFETLGIEKIYSSPLPLGRGMIASEHGPLPLPAPATAELVRNYPVRPVDIEGELVTPTGAAILTTLAEFTAPPPYRLLTVGYGAGSRNLANIPNVLRLFIGETVPAPAVDTVTQIETNLDNTSPEVLGYLAERLFSAGALDVYFVPVTMKKSRPGVLLGLLANPEDREKFAAILFEETGTIGLRYWECQRRKLPRSEEVVQTKYGAVRLKISELDGQKRAAPEYADCARLAEQHHVPYRLIVAEALKAFGLKK